MSSQQLEMVDTVGSLIVAEVVMSVEFSIRSQSLVMFEKYKFVVFASASADE